MSSPATSSLPIPCASSPRPLGTSDPHEARAVLAVVARSAALDAHDRLVAGLPGGSVRTWTTDTATGVVDEVAHRDLVRFATRGALIGGVLLGALTCVIAVTAASQSLGVGAGLGASVALTGGTFFGSLMGFFLATLRWEHAHARVLGHRRRGHGSGVLIIEGDVDTDHVRRILDDHDATAVDTTTI